MDIVGGATRLSALGFHEQGAVMLPRCYPPTWIYYKTLEAKPKGSVISRFLP